MALEKDNRRMPRELEVQLAMPTCAERHGTPGRDASLFSSLSTPDLLRLQYLLDKIPWFSFPCRMRSFHPLLPCVSNAMLKSRLLFSLSIFPSFLF